MPIIPLFGHQALYEQLLARVRDGTLPQSLLFHGPGGVGKQRLALAIGQALLCQTPPVPCGKCQHCRYVAELMHPDLGWVIPRPRVKDDADADDVKYDLESTVRERVEAHGLYPPPLGSDGIYVATIKHLVRQASLTPALSRRKVFVIGDADRMALQEGTEFAANAILKLLEEPLPDTWLILTTSAIGTLPPTIRSRTVLIRVPRLRDEEVRAFVADPVVSETLDKLRLPKGADARVRLASGAPGALLSSRVREDALESARALLAAAAEGPRADRFRLALLQGQRGARGVFSDVLDALTVVLHERVRQDASGPESHRALAATRAIDYVEDAKLLADGNVNPQLITANLLRQLAEVLA